MLMSEAARSGRNFRRTSIPEIWFQLSGKEFLATSDVGNAKAWYKVSIDAEQLVATDWEPEQVRLLLSAEDLLLHSRALDEVVCKRRLSAREFAQLLCIELGLLEEGTPK